MPNLSESTSNSKTYRYHPTTPHAVRLSPDLMAALRELAKQEQLSVPALVTFLVKAGLGVWEH